MNDFKNILYAIDLNNEHPTSIVDAVEFAAMFKSRIHFIYVNDPQAGYRHPTEREDAVALKVRESVPESLLEGLELVYASAKGAAPQEIVRYAEEHQIDLLIVGHKHRNRFFSSMFDSIDVGIIDATKIPVLVIPDR